METHSRWHRGTKDWKNLVRTTVIGKKRTPHRSCLNRHVIDKRSGIILTARDIELNMKFDLENNMRLKYLHVTKGWRTNNFNRLQRA